METIKNIVRLLMVVVLAASCSDAVVPTLGDGEIEAGDKVMFTTFVPDIMQHTRMTKEEWQSEVGAYKAVNREYTFNVEMWKGGETPVKVGESTYQPLFNDNPSTGSGQAQGDGTLQNITNPLYWQDNINKWGFRATAGTEVLQASQNTQEKWLAQDKLEGFSYLPIWDETNQKGIDDFNAINYRTSKEWYRDNQTAKLLSGLMVESNEDYKKIPLYLKHQRSWVTVILKAGEGVTREALAYATSGENIKTTIYSYKEGQSPLEIDAWSREELINYDADKNGDAATKVSTTRYDAIVEPHNFIASRDNEEKDVIARINVSNQTFSFAAANDLNYAAYLTGGESAEAVKAREAMQVYNLQPGKHLTITATLSRASRIIMITAWIEDWTETVTQTICDDYGQNGDPILINNRHELLQFLSDTEKNKAGNVGMIVPNALALDSAEYVWPVDPKLPEKNVPLNATLNLAGCQLTTSKQFVNEIERTGSIINGEIRVTDTFNDPSAIANINKGTVERVRVTTSGELTPARASKAGLVDINYGTIYQCSSALPVYGTSEGYVGGIAAQSLFFGSDGVSPVIDACTVTARVDGDESVIAGGGGIVGQAEGRVSFNTFEYGITMLQDHKFYNIIASIGTNQQGLTNHENNAWPTTASYVVNSVTITNTATGERYNAVIDNIGELKNVLTSTYNQAGNTYRLANSFSVDKENWIWGDDILKDDYFATNITEGYAHGALKCKLDGNDKTITLTGGENATMLFGSIIGEVYDLNLALAKPIVAARIINLNGQTGDSNTDAIAAFAYAITETGKVRNISLKAATNDVYIESSTPGGIAVWASHGGELVNCVSNVPVRMHLTTDGVDARHYAGGIVAVAEKATITQCKYYNENGVGWATGTDASKAQKNNCRYGGIVGGTSEIANSATTPSLILTDCYSWWDLPKFDQEVTDRPYMGSLIGSTVYHKDNVVYNAMADDNAGNWWVGTTGAGYMHGVTEEKAIGKKNSVTPSKPKEW